MSNENVHLAVVRTKLETVLAQVKDIDMRTRRLEKGYWVAVGALSLLEVLRACR